MNKVKQSIKDWIINNYLLVVNYIMHNIFCIKNGRHKVPYDYDLDIYEDFVVYDENLWQKGQYFGNIHPSYPHKYAADDCVEFTDKGLYLTNKKFNRTVDYWDGKTYNTEIDYGILTSKKHFTYGVYEWAVIMPYGQEQWASLWLTGVNSWPPEIDVVEAYSDSDKKYNSSFDTNVHFGGADNKGSIKPMGTLFFKEKHTRRPQIYRLIWEKNKIEIYLNNYKVRVVTNKKILKQLADQPMYVIMNNTVSDGYVNIKENGFGKFIIKYFKHYIKITDDY